MPASVSCSYALFDLRPKDGPGAPCRDHPELSELLCVEMMNRQQDAVGKAAHHQVLTCLPPWMDNLSFAARWEGN